MSRDGALDPIAEQALGLIEAVGTAWTTFTLYPDPSLQHLDSGRGHFSQHSADPAKLSHVAVRQRDRPEEAEQAIESGATDKLDVLNVMQEQLAGQPFGTFSS